MSKQKKQDQKQENKKIDQLVKDYPTVPADVYDVEASEEVAEMYLDMFGY